jgi:hypothetical protein
MTAGLRLSRLAAALEAQAGPNKQPRLTSVQPSEPAELLVETEADSAREAMERASPIIEFLFDRLSFDLQAPLQPGQTEVLDVTLPATTGDEREVAVFASYPGDKFERAEDLGSITAEGAPLLTDVDASLPGRPRAALRWYVKALGTPYFHDRFIFFWIAAEMFAEDSGIAVERPLPLRCGHGVAECPECGEPTRRKVQGASIKKFLEARGVRPELATQAWDLRQMFHGAVQFDSKRLEGLPAVVQELRRVAAYELKQATGIPPESLPIVRAGVPAIHPGMSVSGTRSLAEDDLAWS